MARIRLWNVGNQMTFNCQRGRAEARDSRFMQSRRGGGRGFRHHPAAEEGQVGWRQGISKSREGAARSADASKRSPIRFPYRSIGSIRMERWRCGERTTALAAVEPRVAFDDGHCFEYWQKRGEEFRDPDRAFEHFVDAVDITEQEIHIRTAVGMRAYEVDAQAAALHAFHERGDPIVVGMNGGGASESQARGFKTGPRGGGVFHLVLLWLLACCSSKPRSPVKPAVVVRALTMARCESRFSPTR